MNLKGFICGSSWPPCCSSEPSWAAAKLKPFFFLCPCWEPLALSFHSEFNWWQLAFSWELFPKRFSECIIREKRKVSLNKILWLMVHQWSTWNTFINLKESSCIYHIHLSLHLFSLNSHPFFLHHFEEMGNLYLCNRIRNYFTLWWSKYSISAQNFPDFSCLIT